MSVLDASVVLKWFVDEEDSDKAIQLREEYYVTCYDAAYLALAGDLGFEFITADGKFYNKVQDEVKKVTPIKLLADLKEGTEEGEKMEEET